MIRFRTATLNELGQVLDWAASEGWNPGLEDASAFYAADPGGFFVALDDAQPVAAISVVNHSDRFAFLGLYIVLPSHRGRGIGLDLWRHAMAHAGHRTIGLDGVPDQQANYAASGFQHAGGTTRYAGPVVPEDCADIRPATEGDVSALIQAEARASGTGKPAYLTAWFSNTETRRTFVDRQGFCTVRKCRDGAKIGPLLAETDTAARRLIRHAATAFAGPVIIDVPAQSKGLGQLCRDFGLQPGFETARMYKGPAPKGAGDFFAVTSLELG